MSLSKRDWERLIRQLAEDSSRLKWTNHAKTRMRERNLNTPVVLDVLRKGVINREPEPNIKTGCMECRMDRYVAGRNIGVVVALESGKATSCIVVTTLIIGE